MLGVRCGRRQSVDAASPKAVDKDLAKQVRTPQVAINTFQKLHSEFCLDAIDRNAGKRIRTNYRKLTLLGLCCRRIGSRSSPKTS